LKSERRVTAYPALNLSDEDLVVIAAWNFARGGSFEEQREHLGEIGARHLMDSPRLAKSSFGRWVPALRSQIVTLKGAKQIKYLPYEKPTGDKIAGLAWSILPTRGLR
jgi:hypothetical protein